MEQSVARSPVKNARMKDEIGSCVFFPLFRFYPLYDPVTRANEIQVGNAARQTANFSPC